MNVLFIGAVEFSALALNTILEFNVNVNVVGICTKSSSKFNNDFVDLRGIAQKYKIPYHYTTNLNSGESLEWIIEKKIDIIFCFGWSSLIKKELLDLPPMGVVGFHPAELPFNRGRHPIIWALALGLKKTASTFFFMEEGADDGDILSQEIINISSTDNARTLYNKVSRSGVAQIQKFLPELLSGVVKRRKQDHSLANIWRKRGELDGKIDFRMSSNAIFNLVRALSEPYVGAHLYYKETDIKIWEVIEEDNHLNNIEPGKVLDVTKDSLLVKTGDGAVWLTDHEFLELPQIGEYL